MIVNTARSPFRTWIDRAEELAAQGRFEIGIPMRDGLELAADVYLPADADGRKFPAIVQVTGLSYMGWVQWAAASLRPPHLRAMVSTSAAGRWQQEIPYTNGVFQLYFGWWAYATRRRILDFYGLEHADWDEILRTLPFEDIGKIINSAGANWEDLCRRDTLDDFYRALRYEDRYPEIDIPCLHVTGWYDQEDLLGAFHHYEHMREKSPAREWQFLLVGPWSHVRSRFPDAECGGVDFGASAAHDMDAEHLRWFDHWLKGRDTGLGDVDRVRVFEPGRNSWRGADRWPLSDGVTSLYLAPGGGLRPAPPEEEQICSATTPAMSS
jgi:putative CocE/NonD family hydrolase